MWLVVEGEVRKGGKRRYVRWEALLKWTLGRVWRSKRGGSTGARLVGKNGVFGERSSDV